MTNTTRAPMKVSNMAIEVTSERAVCSRCSTSYSRRKGYFPVSYAVLHKGIGYIPVCKDCIDSMYNTYLSQCAGVEDPAKAAVRQMCRKLDLYWSEKVYAVVEKKNTPRSMMTQYIAKINSLAYVGKCYDDTLSDEGTLWDFCKKPDDPEQEAQLPGSVDETHKGTERVVSEPQAEEDIDIPEDVVRFWGSGYTASMYKELEERKTYYMSKMQNNGNDIDIGAEALIKQICNLEVAISRDAAAGRAIDKNVSTLNTLLGSLNLKPAQKKNDDVEAEISSTPLGVWLYKFENKRPLPEVDEQLKDVNHLKKYIFTWMGHLCKMLGVKNGYTKLYEDEVRRLRVDKPEYDGEDDETVLIDAYSEDPSGDEHENIEQDGGERHDG